MLYYEQLYKEVEPMKKTILTLSILITAACVRAPEELNGQQVFFAFDSAEISTDAKKDLKAQALYMKQNPDVKITMQGRCDERGSTEYNLALGALRAANASHIMIENGIEPERIKTVSYGKETAQRS